MPPVTQEPTEFVYLSEAQLVELNLDQENGGGVRDLEGLRRCVDRRKTEVFGAGFLTVWAKAAAYVHGIAKNHPFLGGQQADRLVRRDGLPRTERETTAAIPTIEAETFVLAVALDAFDTDDAPGLTVSKAAEWFKSKWATTAAPRRGKRPACGVRVRRRPYQRGQHSWQRGHIVGRRSGNRTLIRHLTVPSDELDAAHRSRLNLVEHPKTRTENTQLHRWRNTDSNGFFSAGVPLQASDSAPVIPTPSPYPHHPAGLMPTLFIVVAELRVPAPCPGDRHLGRRFGRGIDTVRGPRPQVVPPSG